MATRRNGGQQDIYVSERESPDDPWGEPKPLGPNINTFGVDDFCPMLSIDGHTLFFRWPKVTTMIRTVYGGLSYDIFGTSPAEHPCCVERVPG